MTPADFIVQRSAPLRLVIFDCDGVLIDSEATASRVVAEQLTTLGWPMDTPTALRLFLGMTLADMEPVITAHFHHALDPNWRACLTQAIVQAMSHEAQLIDGALQALDAADALGLPWRVASNSSPAELAAKFARTGLTARTAGRVHSFTEVASGKPAPDLFLAAAAAQGATPAECLVIEDSLPGATAARAAGMACLGYAPHSNAAAIATQGACLFTSMHELPHLLALATQVFA